MAVDCTCLLWPLSVSSLEEYRVQLRGGRVAAAICPVSIYFVTKHMVSEPHCMLYSFQHELNSAYIDWMSTVERRINLLRYGKHNSKAVI